MLRLKRAPALVALTVATSLAPAIAAAQTQGGSGEQSLQNQDAQASAAELQAVAAVHSAEQQAAELTDRAAELKTQLDAAQAALDPLQARVDELTAQAKAAEQALADAKARLDSSAGSILITESQSQGYDSLEAVVPSDLVTAEHDLGTLARARTTIVERVTTLRESVAAKQAAAEDAARPFQADRDRIATLLTQVQPAETQAVQAQAAAQAQLTAIRAQKGTIEVELNALDGAADSIAVLLRSLGILPGPVASCDVRPVSGGITSPFGPRIDPITGNPGFHTGVDLQATYGTPILACRSGTVVIASPQGGYGNAVVIDHAGGMATLYAHQSRMAVLPGQVVKAGDVIGYVGATGYATGPHLHFEVRLDGNPVNPVSFLP